VLVEGKKILAIGTNLGAGGPRLTRRRCTLLPGNAYVMLTTKEPYTPKVRGLQRVNGMVPVGVASGGLRFWCGGFVVAYRRSSTVQFGQFVTKLTRL